MKRKYRIIVAAAFVLGSLLVIGTQQAWSTMRNCHQSYYLLNPHVQCSNSIIKEGSWDYEPLRDMLLKKRTELMNAKKVSEMSIYFRDLDNGPRFGIGEYGEFRPASLLKLPVLIAFLHEADLHPEILDKTLSFSGSLGTNENVEQPDESIEPDTPYTIRELLTKMIVFSDNYSYVLLTREMNAAPPPTMYHTFNDLGVLRMMTAPNADFVSIQSYSNLFAVLYNTGYLSKQMSQFALNLLSETTFDAGLEAGVPQNIRVAHKFGIRPPGTAQSQLHDCGIVYHPSMAYVLCIMTSGDDLRSEESAIADMSAIVYDNISSLSFRDFKGRQSPTNVGK